MVLSLAQVPGSAGQKHPEAAAAVVSPLMQLLFKDIQERRQARTEAEQMEETATALENLLNKDVSPTMATPVKPEGYDTLPETIRRPEEQWATQETPNPEYVKLPRDKHILEKTGEALLGSKKPSLEELFVAGAMPEEQSARYLQLKQTLTPVTTMDGNKPVLSALGNKTGEMTRLGNAKPMSINTNSPSDEEVKNAAWKVANGEMTLSQIPARSTARMKVINELATNPAYKSVNLAQSAANIKKMQDPSLIRSNSLIAAIDKPMKKFESAFINLNNTGIMPVNAGANWFLKNAGDPRIAEVNAYRNELVREIQRALVNTGAMAHAGVEQQMDVLNATYSLPQIKSSLAAIDEILKARMETQAAPAFPDSKPLYDPRTQTEPSNAPQQGGIIPRQPGESLADYMRRTKGGR